LECSWPRGGGGGRGAGVGGGGVVVLVVVGRPPPPPPPAPLYIGGHAPRASRPLPWMSWGEIGFLPELILFLPNLRREYEFE
jgi:hypothetical protein